MEKNSIIKRSFIDTISGIGTSGTTWTLPLRHSIDKITVIADTDGAVVSLVNATLLISSVITCTSKDTRYVWQVDYESLAIGEWILSLDVTVGTFIFEVEYSNTRQNALSRTYLSGGDSNVKVLTSDELGAINFATSPGALNPFVTQSVLNGNDGTNANTFTVDEDSTAGKIKIDVALGAADKTMTITNAALTDDRVVTIKNETQILANEADVAEKMDLPSEVTPVNGEKATVTIDMTNVDADLTYTAVVFGEDGNDITVTHVDPSANNATLDVTVSGTDITVSLATDGGGLITSTAAQVKAAVNADPEASLLVLCEDENAGAGVVNAVVQTPLTGGVDVTAGEVGQVLFSSTEAFIKLGAQTWKKWSLSSL